MRIGLGSLFLLPFKFKEGLRFAQRLGVQAIEMACVGQPSREYCDPDKLLADHGELQRWLDVLKEHGLGISAFAVHGEPLSPNKHRADAYSRRFRQVCKLAEAAGVDRLTTNGGLPEGAPGDTCPLWVADSFKPYNRSILSWQWEQRLIPFWREHAKIAQDHGCLVCLEPWVGEIVYSPKTLMKLRDAVGPVIGCNLDPSHLFVQQIDVIESIKFLSKAIYNIHIKDTRIDPENLKLQGLFDDTPHIHPERRAWAFTLIGWGHDEAFWHEFITALRFVGYEGSLSVEMECDYIDVKEGIEKSVAFLKSVFLETPPGKRWWEYAWEREDMVNWWGMPPAMED